ncbi:MAG: hypothetical protein LBJ80_01610, partial [Rickettsiales bacterium]|nr:hypothetical protein [Rickettsiales bacterium]
MRTKLKPGLKKILREVAFRLGFKKINRFEGYSSVVSGTSGLLNTIASRVAGENSRVVTPIYGLANTAEALAPFLTSSPNDIATDIAGAISAALYSVTPATELSIDIAKDNNGRAHPTTPGQNQENIANPAQDQQSRFSRFVTAIKKKGPLELFGLFAGVPAATAASVTAASLGIAKKDISLVPIPFGYGADLTNFAASVRHMMKSSERRKLLSNRYGIKNILKLQHKFRNSDIEEVIKDIKARTPHFEDPELERPDVVQSYIFPTLSMVSNIATSAARTVTLFTGGTIPATSIVENASYTFGNIVETANTLWKAFQKSRLTKHNQHAHQLNRAHAEALGQNRLNNISGLDLAYNNRGLFQGLRLAQDLPPKQHAQQRRAPRVPKLFQELGQNSPPQQLDIRIRELNREHAEILGQNPLQALLYPEQHTRNDKDKVKVSGLDLAYNNRNNRELFKGLKLVQNLPPLPPLPQQYARQQQAQHGPLLGLSPPLQTQQQQQTQKNLLLGPRKYIYPYISDIDHTSSSPPSPSDPSSISGIFRPSYNSSNSSLSLSSPRSSSPTMPPVPYHIYDSYDIFGKYRNYFCSSADNSNTIASTSPQSLRSSSNMFSSSYDAQPIRKNEDYITRPSNNNSSSSSSPSS